jgi:hypothetical protein
LRRDRTGPPFGITIVQPGLSKADVSFDQLQLLAVTENHLFERANIPFKVVASTSANG